MSRPEDIAALVREMYAARQLNTRDAVEKYFDPDIAFRVAGSGLLHPMTAPIRGAEALRGVLDSLLSTWDWSGFGITSVNVDADKAFVHLAGKIRHLPSGTLIDTEILDVLTYKEGRIIAFTEFLDTQLVAKTPGLG